MKNMLTILRLFTIAVLVGIAMPTFGNNNDNPGPGNDGGIPTGDDTNELGGTSVNADGTVLNNSDGPGGGNGNSNLNDAGVPIPAAAVVVHADPTTGQAYTGTPLYFTGNFFIADNGFGPLSSVAITVIAPDGTQTVQIGDATKGGTVASFTFNYTTSFTLNTPGTYQVFAAVIYNSVWYQDYNTFSRNGGVTWTTYTAATTPLFYASKSSGFLPLTNGSGNLTSFTVVDGTHQDTVYTQAFPKPGLELWFQPSNVVSKTFQIQGKNNPAPPF
jgi:hypothetical protein